MQLDAEEDGQPFYRPPVGVTAPSAAPPPAVESTQKTPEGETDQHAAAVATAEQEE